MFVEVTIAGAVLLYGLLYYHFRYWKRRGIPQLSPSIPFGDIGPVFRQKQYLAETYATLYHKSKQFLVAGIYLSLRPVLLVNDPHLIKDILVRDFDHFYSRGVYADEKRDPMSAHLFSIAGEQWRNLRQKLNPAFSPVRLRGMLPILTDVGRTLQEYIGKCAEAGEVVEVREVMGRYTTDVIASVAFGLEVDSINDGSNTFRQMGLKVFGNDLKNSLRLACTFFVPEFKELLGFNCAAPEVEQFIRNVVRETIEYRESNNVSRQDLMQLLLQLRNSGMVSSDGKWDLKVTDGAKSLSLEQIMANTFAFFFAGYETSSAAISFTLYELAKNPPFNGRSSKNRFSPLPIYISLLGLGRDPQYYPEPERFIPERFENETEMQTLPFYPFGGGPRTCIAGKLGQLQTKLALALLLSKFDMKLANEDEGEIRFDPKALTLIPIGGLKLVFTKRT
ncbi:cytochrome P450 6d3 [Culex quinquefasciatus]|uniref:Cytochrome P450 6d3 n=1 Tax=Culex quinquefasciatus TaxID=7176 RepID=B0WPB9_CULQU|nr:cytochrome P450 6d3 [Culex quinquefasciatus]|eukprot:XP_001850553.1 cytochrome P450 6d3 [Culex quinquefasciatus]